MSVMSWRSWLLSTALLGACVLGRAEAVDPVAWRCWYDQDVHLTCVLRSAPAQLEPMTLPAGLPGVVKELRNNPEAFRNRFVHIPLISPVIDMRFAAVLARATMCGSRQACSVSFVPLPPSAAERRAMQARLLEAEMEIALFGSELSELE